MMDDEEPIIMDRWHEWIAANRERLRAHAHQFVLIDPGAGESGIVRSSADPEEINAWVRGIPDAERSRLMLIRVDDYL